MAIGCDRGPQSNPIRDRSQSELDILIGFVVAVTIRASGQMYRANRPDI